ncbi:hypothetical protein EJ08DRAFT_378774 [Tothia fuscella]|uniref:Sialidase n=1 Tax=Tothia fuscella TaxID=1048955 RepID=A0A9P4NKZ0_9PEZI|nr:hypothetical protein EJ08DRAFT_378774 [Tothia fuscella]
MFQTERHTTPPSMNSRTYFPNSADSHNTNVSYYASTRNSPESVGTGLSTPPRESSPGTTTLRHQGPLLLPRIRCQDQATEPSAGPVRHHRIASAAAASYHFSPYPYGIQKSMPKRNRTRSPEGRESNPPAPASFSHSSYTPLSAISSSVSPASGYTSATSLSSHNNFPSGLAVQSFNDCTELGISNELTSPISLYPSHSVEGSRRSSLAHVRTASLPAAPHHGHSRSASASSVDEATIWRHGYPTQYRQIPQYVTASPLTNASTAMSAPPMQTSISAGPTFTMRQEPAFPVEEEFNFNTFPHDMAAFTPEPAAFSHESSMIQQETTSMLSYLTTANPSPALIARSVTGDFAKRNKDWWWWDVRTIRSWADFDINTIMAVPGFQQTLHVPIYSAGLPHPSRACAPPETEHNLRAVYRDFLATKINAALKITPGDSQLVIQAINSSSNNPYPMADFISSYASDYMVTQHNDPRGRLVGLVMPYQHWNTAMRTEAPAKQVAYLHGLSHLHRVMREHGCRYGFIITEIEFLSVRIGANDEAYRPSANPNVPDEGPLPWFGFLETAAPISLSTHGLDPKTNAPRLTAGLALWYLHMLAKDEPLPGQPGWKIGVGGPAARTRQHCLDRDAWMPKITQHDTRPAKNCRGWVFPTDPFHKKENAKKDRMR